MNRLKFGLLILITMTAAAQEAYEFSGGVKPEDLRVFSDRRGNYIMISMDHYPRVLFAGTGKDFYRLKPSGMNISGENFSVNLVDPNYPRPNSLVSPPSRLEYFNGKLSLRCGFDLVNFTEVQEPKAKALRAKANFRDLPEVRQPAYLLTNRTTGEKIYIDKSKYREGNFKFYMGKPGELKESEILDYSLFDDRGTAAWFKTAAGELSLPTFEQATFRPQGTEAIQSITIEKITDLTAPDLEPIIGRELAAAGEDKPLVTACDPALANAIPHAAQNLGSRIGEVEHPVAD